MNPETKEPAGKKRTYSILETSCYDDSDNPEDTWSHDPDLLTLGQVRKSLGRAHQGFPEFGM
eukprot:3226851-Karenia_brevis.AAC.1